LRGSHQKTREGPKNGERGGGGGMDHLPGWSLSSSAGDAPKSVGPHEEKYDAGTKKKKKREGRTVKGAIRKK